jgi:hypothetical protein
MKARGERGPTAQALRLLAIFKKLKYVSISFSVRIIDSIQCGRNMAG